MAFVYSTLANSQLYTEWVKGGNDLMIKGREVFIKGGAGVISNDNRLITPLGLATEVEDELLPVLENNPVFKIHLANGFVSIVQGKKKAPDVETIAPDLNQEDSSKPLTPSDFENKNSDIEAIPKVQ